MPLSMEELRFFATSKGKKKSKPRKVIWDDPEPCEDLDAVPVDDPEPSEDCVAVAVDEPEPSQVCVATTWDDPEPSEDCVAVAEEYAVEEPIYGELSGPVDGTKIPEDCVAVAEENAVEETIYDELSGPVDETPIPEDCVAVAEENAVEETIYGELSGPVDETPIPEAHSVSDMIGHEQTTAQKPSDGRPSASKESPAPPLEGPKFARLFTTQPLTLLVGPNKRKPTPFYLHKQCLATHSSYFASLLQRPGSEANTVTLDTAPLDSIDAFEMFVDYLYRGTYTASTELETDKLCVLHARVYVLAERLGVGPLKALALEKMGGVLAGAYADGWLGVDVVVEVVDIVYGFTRGVYEDVGESCEGVVREGRGVPSGKGKERFAMEFFGRKDEIHDGMVLGWLVESPALSEDGLKEGTEDLVATEEVVQGWAEEETREVPRSESFADAEERKLAEGESDRGKSDPWPPTDKMRKLVSRYAASQASVLKAEAKFLKVVMRRREFALDLFLAGNDGARVGSDEVGKL